MYFCLLFVVVFFRSCFLLDVLFDTFIHQSFTYIDYFIFVFGARCSSVVRAFAHDAMGRRIDPS